MRYLKRSVLLSVFLISSLSIAQMQHKDVSRQDVEAAIKKAFLVHPPSLLINTEDQQAIQDKISADPFFKALSDSIIKDADRRVGLDPVVYEVRGRRLLHVSSECQARVVTLAMAYRLTGERKYLAQAEKEMLAAAAFPDWNPSHFLDVAVMTAGLSIGYDWLFADLPRDSRRRISTAIIKKGLEPSLKYDHWTQHRNNWNQVCNGGMVIGALAVRRQAPELAAEIIHRGITTIRFPMDDYEPHGAYPEGPSYWSFGTRYNVMMIAALQSVLGTDFGLSQFNGFANSADYYLHATGSSGWYFNYGDGGLGGGVNPIVYWFAHRYNKPYLTFYQGQRLWPQGAAEIKGRPSWVFPMLLLWGQTDIVVPEALSWMGTGKTPVAAFRSSWTDPDAAYLAIKGGHARTPHAHIDAGTFVYEVDGVRWAAELGHENYHKIESLGMDLWNRSQHSDRWTIFRYNNFSHNTLTVNDELHHVNGVAQLVRYCDQQPRPNAVFDLSEVFSGQIENAFRGVALLGRQALIQDELIASQEAATVRWAMVAPGKAEILSPTTARLTEQGKTLLVEVHSPKAAQLQIYSTEPREEWDSPNPNTFMIGFEVKLQPQEHVRMAVTLTPGSAKQKQTLEPLIPLQEWSPLVLVK